jgi:hypothetical protein
VLGRRVLTVAAGVVAGAAAVAAIWWWVGDGEAASAFGRDAGIAPPDYAYLDSARVVLYLGQLEGGLAESEKLTEELTQNRNATIAASGFQIGGSAGRSSATERVVTPTATARFYRLLDSLDARGFLRTVDAAAGGKAMARSFARIPEGSFVRLRNCRLELPGYVEFGQAVPARRRLSPAEAWNAYLAAGGAAEDYQTVQAANVAAGRAKGLVDTPLLIAPERVKRALAAAAPALARVVRQNPRVPASCGTAANPARGALDLLLPIRLGEISPERSLLAGPVTVVGKVVRAVRPSDDPYVDSASLALFDAPVSRAGLWAGEDSLAAGVTVLPPGAVILPIAIYK